ncbi:Hypothetical_protein [Hexamita inflata]|uniref:Hypothetical_protein n=1 Tax=Hexamita inflata TaxID=28002 RepID=A0AA86U3Q4_9EUKA|nr:Hypothetical protein HINF_LOCUS26251 [Hexamita inflata]
MSLNNLPPLIYIQYQISGYPETVTTQLLYTSFNTYQLGISQLLSQIQVMSSQIFAEYCSITVNNVLTYNFSNINSNVKILLPISTNYFDSRCWNNTVNDTFELNRASGYFNTHDIKMIQLPINNIQPSVICLSNCVLNLNNQNTYTVIKYNGFKWAGNITKDISLPQNLIVVGNGNNYVSKPNNQGLQAKLCFTTLINYNMGNNLLYIDYLENLRYQENPQVLFSTNFTCIESFAAIQNNLTFVNVNNLDIYLDNIIIFQGTDTTNQINLIHGKTYTTLRQLYLNNQNIFSVQLGYKISYIELSNIKFTQQLLFDQIIINQNIISANTTQTNNSNFIDVINKLSLQAAKITLNNSKLQCQNLTIQDTYAQCDQNSIQITNESIMVNNLTIQYKYIKSNQQIEVNINLTNWQIIIICVVGGVAILLVLIRIYISLRLKKRLDKMEFEVIIKKQYNNLIISIE